MSSVTRRDFLKLVGAGSVGTGAGFVLAEAAKRPVEQYIPYVVTPEDYTPGVATWYNTVCGQCSAGCGISVRIREGRAKKIEGNPSHPVNQGRLCALGQAGVQVLYNPDRLQSPLRRTGAKGSGQFEPVTWDAALEQLATQLKSRGAATRVLTGAIRGHTHALLDELLNAIGAPPYVQYDALAPEALYAANRTAFGFEVLPYYDVRNADLVVSFGADLLGTWLSPVHHGLGYGHLRQGEGRKRGRLVQVEPRMSLTGANADVWLPARPGTEGLLVLALAHAVLAAGRYGGEDREDWESALADYAPERVAERCGLEPSSVRALAEEYARSPRPLALGGGAAASGTNGGATLLAVNALNYLSGSLGVPGGVLANPPAPIPDGRERRGGHAAVRALLDAAAGGTLIVHDANPAFTLPAATGAQAALAKPELLVYIGSFMDETAVLADLVLPTHTFLEAWWDDAPEPGVGFPVASIAQPVVTPLYDTRSFGDIVLALAARIGGPVAAALPAADTQTYLKQAWGRIYAARREALEQPTFDAFWNAVLKAGVWGERAGPVAPAVDAAALRSGLAYREPEYDGNPLERPFVLHPFVTAAFHDGRGANLPWMQELPDPLTSIVYNTWVELNPATARELGIEEGDLVEVQSSAGTLVAPAFPYHAIRPDVVAIPLGQGHTHYGRYATGRGANPLAILAPKTDALSGALATGATRVALRRTGERVRIAKTDGVTRTLGRQILGPGEGHGAGGGHGA